MNAETQLAVNTNANHAIRSNPVKGDIGNLTDGAQLRADGDDDPPQQQ
jgi:hypothetical protein